MNLKQNNVHKMKVSKEHRADCQDIQEIKKINGGVLF
jgi:hypothetical protein